MTSQIDFRLDDKYRQRDGTIILSGVQALVRLPIDQYYADRANNLHTATFISGYRGSPLGGIDIELQRNMQLLQEHEIVFMPGVNEDLAATSVLGSQLANNLPNPKYDGVLGMWYGKGPGVDRSGDIFKHAQITGLGRYGGVLAVAGDDPVAKSSTIPSGSELALYDANMPILYPGNVQEILDYGRLGFALSRYSGLWVGFKVVTDVADAFDTAHISPDQIAVQLPEFEYHGDPWQPTQDTNLLAPNSLYQEREIHEGRLTAATLFGEMNGLNQIITHTPDDWLGIVTAGKTYYDLREALQLLGFSEADLNRAGIRLLKLGMLYPMEPKIVQQFAHGLDEILVIEEKRSFIELFIRDALYHLPQRPRVVGKRDEHGEFLIRGDSELDANQISRYLYDRYAKQVEGIPWREPYTPPPVLTLPMATTARTPYFCSGCPHNRSTVAPDGALVGGGIGCHTMVLLMGRDIIGLTHMGGEGAQWAGMSPFTDTNHIFQNMGDGTLFHSGSLAIRHVVASDANVTYKILYNSAVAMTGGQVADGEMPVPELTRALQAEGVRKIIVVAQDPNHYPADTQWANGVQVWHRDRLDEAQELLQNEPGVTALIYDQECAAELRRKRRRGTVEEPPMRVVINEEVCEGCGDCGVKSNCLSVFPVETEFGRKTRIHQSSCNRDYTCLEGDCPAFITVIPDEEDKKSKTVTLPNILAEDIPPLQQVPDTGNVYMMGIGGTGVVSVNGILGTAAHLSGKQVRSLAQTGLSQKGGPVIAHLKVLTGDEIGTNKVAYGDADTYLVFDALTGTMEERLKRANPTKTRAVVSQSQTPTGAMVQSTSVSFPPFSPLTKMIDRRTLPDQNVYLDAIHLSETLFGSHMQANLICVGAAYQAGMIPIPAEMIEQAIEVNRVLVPINQQAFRVGRMVVANPAWVQSELEKRADVVSTAPKSSVSAEARKLIDMIDSSPELTRLLEIRVPELIAYQNQRYAKDYIEFVAKIRDRECAAIENNDALSIAVARYLYKLMAYKDEYEVARLHLKSDVHTRIQKEFGSSATYQYNLLPPIFRGVGLKRKLKFGTWFNPFFQLLVWSRRLRGTPLDIFGYARVRRVERDLIQQYRNLIEEATESLSPSSYERSVELAKLPDMIRGYEEIKLENVSRFWEAVDALHFDDDDDLHPDHVAKVG